MINVRPGESDNRILPERANLEFHYPDKTIVIIPFYENPKITERGQGTYAEYNPINRGGSLYAYTGAKSRSFKIEATYTLPHLLRFPMGIRNFMRLTGNTHVDQKNLFFSNTKQNINPGPATQQPTSLAYQARKLFYQFRLDQATPEELSNTTALQSAGIPTNASFLNNLPTKESDKTIDSVLFFLAVFRSSILNNSRNPLEGPPIIRLNFGAVYDSIPCIVKNYDISYEEEGGYDVETLTPRIFKISLNLNELRTGDFGLFERNLIVKRDNLTGWESVLDTSIGCTIDPGKIL